MSVFLFLFLLDIYVQSTHILSFTNAGLKLCYENAGFVNCGRYSDVYTTHGLHRSVLCKLSLLTSENFVIIMVLLLR